MTVTAAEALRLLLDPSARAVDVRSEGEFASAAVPGFINLPILCDPERHEVGLRFKQAGQDSAIELGRELTLPHREARTAAWKTALSGTEIPLLTCFRGGLRSRIACEWLEAAGAKALRVEGGYKSMRQELLASLESPPRLLVVAGPTGSGKTSLLRACRVPKLDLELLANHKGSAFGKPLTGSQPAQASFENAVGMELRRLPREVLAEDESALIGRVSLPKPIMLAVENAQVIRIRMERSERVTRLLGEYVTVPLAAGFEPAFLRAHYEEALARIEPRLGGLAASELRTQLREAFHGGGSHESWIEALLELYYDKLYEYSFQRLPRETAFEGDWDACKQWIQNKFA